MTSCAPFCIVHDHSDPSAVNRLPATVSAWINSLCPWEGRRAEEEKFSHGDTSHLPHGHSMCLTRIFTHPDVASGRSIVWLLRHSREHLTSAALRMPRSSRCASRYGHLQGKTQKAENKQNSGGFLAKSPSKEHDA